MRTWIPVAFASLGLASQAEAQRFGFTHRMLPAENGSTAALALGDVDGDGDLDAFVGHGGTVFEQSRLHLNDGTGVFADVTTTSLPALVSNTWALALGDVDGDGDLDAFLGSGWPGPLRFWRNAGGGSFTDVTATNLPGFPVDTRALALGDVDGDGDLDLFAGNFGQPSRLYGNGGGGTAVFTDVTATTLPALVSDTRALALGDVDGDGDLDALLGNDGQDRLYLNGGAGIFTDVSATNLPLETDLTRALALADVDGDGDLDAFAGNSGSSPTPGGQNRLFLNAGTGVFTDATATSLPPLLGSTRAVALGDVDGDGDVDAYVGNVQGQENRLYLNGGAGVFLDVTPTNLPASIEFTEAVALGDVDGDGDLDALLGGSVRQDRLQLNGGAGVFTDVTGADLPPVLDTPRAVALGDLDGDGDLDALVGNYWQQDRLYRNGGTGAFSDVTWPNLPTLVDNTIDVVLGDVDGDGDLDAFLANVYQPSVLYLNDGTAAFTDVTATNLPSLVVNAGAAALEDVDGDGDLDAFVGIYGQSRLLVNGGTGIFTDVTATNLPAQLNWLEAVAFGDIDGDGDFDAFLGNTVFLGSVPDRLYLNGGTGIFTDATATNLPEVYDTTTAVALGDVDGDGDLDAFVGNSGEPNRLYRNDGTGVFTDVTASYLPALVDDTRAVALGDAEGDGDLDAFVGNYNQQNRLYLNGGTGTFADVTATELPALPDFTLAVALGDVDGDGDLDAFAANNGQENQLYANLTRQLAWRGIPRAGKPVTLDLWGPVNGTWLLAASTGTADIPLPPFGTLRLFLPTLLVVAGGPLDPQGRASLTFPVPANPALVGASLYWQAVVGPPLRFTNLEVTTVTDL